MMMQNILAHASLGSGMVADTGTNTRRTKVSDFEMFLGNSIKRDTKITERASDVKDSNDTSETGSKKTASKIVRDTDLKTSSKEVDFKDYRRKPVIRFDEDSSDYDLATAEQVLAMLDQVRNVIMNALEVTSEELDQMMEELGLNNVDLLDPQGIMQVLLNNSGAADSTAILLDEQLGNTFRGLISAVDDIKKDLHTEISQNMIEQILEQESVLSTNDKFMADDGAITIKADVAEIKEQNTSGESRDNSNKFRVSDNDIVDQEHLVTSGKNSATTDTEDWNEGFGETDGFEAFLDKLNTNYEQSVAELTEDTVKLHDIKEIARQIIEQIRVMVKPGQTTMELQLYPEHLGKVNISLSASEGVMSARFVVQNELAKEAVESQLISLKETLAQQDIKVESIEVTVAGYSFEQNSRSDEGSNMKEKKSGSRHKITFEEAVAMSEDPGNEDTTVYIPGTSGYNIDYTA